MKIYIIMNIWKYEIDENLIIIYQMHSVMLGLVVAKFGFRQLFLILQIVYRLLFLTKASFFPQP